MGEDREFYKRPPVVIWYGRLDGGQDNPSLWRGTISAKFEILKARLALTEDAEVRQHLDEKKAEVNNY